MSAPFGKPGSVDPQRVSTMAPAMRREGALMLLDMGMTDAAASRHLGMSFVEFDRLVHGAQPLLRRGGETDLAGDHA